MTKTQKEQLIAKATERAIEERDLYIQEQTDNLVDALETSEDEVKTANTAEKDSGSHSENKIERKRTSSSYVTFGNLLDTLKSKRENVKIHNYEQLNDFIDKSLKEEGVGVTPKTKSDLFQHLNHYDKPEKEKNIGGQVREITEELQENNSQTMTNAANAMYKQGIYDGIETLAKGKVPGYADLTESEKDKLAADVFEQTDADTSDSLANSNEGLEKVNRKLTEEISKNIDSETDLDKAFKTAQAHTKSNVRTELVRAHTLGQIEVYKAAGIKNFIWQLRGVTCPVCMPLAGKMFPLNEPAPPKHHNCDCYIVPGISETSNNLLTPEEGQKILEKAKEWIGTPYKKGKAEKGVEAGCSRFVNKVYKDARYPYQYSDTKSFSKNSKFKQVDKPQPGDVVLFKGHMGLYDPSKKGNDVLSATSTKGVRYGANYWFGGNPKYYRYQK